MLPVGSVVRLKKSSRSYAANRHSTSRLMGVILQSNNTRCIVQWICGVWSVYEVFDLEVWLGFTVIEEELAKQNGTYDELFRTYASEKGIKLARENGQYIPRLITEDGGEGDGGNGEGVIETGSPTRGDIGFVDRGRYDWLCTRQYGVREDESGTISSFIYTGTGGGFQDISGRPHDHTQESMDLIIRRMSQSSSYGDQYRSPSRGGISNGFINP